METLQGPHSRGRQKTYKRKSTTGGLAVKEKNETSLEIKRSTELKKKKKSPNQKTYNAPYSPKPSAINFKTATRYAKSRASAN